MRMFFKMVVITVALSGLTAPDVAVVAAQGRSIPDLFLKLKSNETAGSAARQLLSLSRSDPAVKEYLRRNLPPVIDAEPSHTADQWPDPVWLNAVRLAGELKIEEAAPSLAKWISVRNSPIVSLSAESYLKDSPAGHALVQIGNPAIPALQKVLNQGNDDERWESTRALHLIGTPEAVAVLREHLNSETDESLVSTISKATSHDK
jgi:PBS lyase HEAT-like repeat